MLLQNIAMLLLSNTACHDAERVHAGLPELPAGVIARVSAAPEERGVRWTLALNRGGRQWARTFVVKSEDCQQTPRLVAAIAGVLAQSFRPQAELDAPRNLEFALAVAPRRPQLADPAIRPQPEPAPARLVSEPANSRRPEPEAQPWAPPELSVLTSVGAAFGHLRGAFELGVKGAFGPARNRLITTLTFEVGTPVGLASGRVLETSAVAGLGWRHQWQDFQFELEARAGVMTATGLGFDDNRTEVLPSVWLGGAVLRRFSGWSLGSAIFASPVRHTLRVSNGGTAKTTVLRAAVVAEIPVAVF